MNRYALFTAILLALGNLTIAQDPNRASAIADRQAAEERDRLFNSAIERMDRTIAAQQSEINRLKTRNEDLQREINDVNAKFREAIGNTVTQKQLQALVDSIMKVDKNRLADRDLFIEQLKEIKKIAAEKPAPIIVTNPAPIVETRTRNGDKEKEKEEETTPIQDNPDGYHQYTIKPKDNLSAILSAYNAVFKEEGRKTITLEQLKKANPKLNPNNIQVGRVVQVPIPPKK